MTTVLTTKDLSKRYGSRRGVDKINLEIQEGDLFGFLGPNGAGKSTTIRMLLGLLQPSQGHATLLGQDAWQQSPEIKKEVGYVPGDVRLYSWMTARKALKVIGRIRGKNISKNGEKLSERFGLELDLAVRKMSRGTRQKLALILAMAHNPKVLILDEPTSGLDPIVQLELAKYLREFTGQGGTVFFSSHTLSEVEQLCNRVAIVRDGKIVADETLKSLFKKAPRIVHLEFEKNTAVELPKFLKLRGQNENHVESVLEGTPIELMQWAAGQQLLDISISTPDLEELFHQFYETKEQAL